MQKLILLFLLISLVVMPKYSVAQKFSLDGEFRPRMEFRDGFKKPLADSVNSELIVLQRSRLTFDYASNSVNSRFTLQDARVWGQEDNKGGTTKLGIFEAWAEMLLTSGLSVQFGRQALSYDDQRLFSVSNWSNTGSAHDAILIKYKETGLQAHLGFAYNNTNDTLFQYQYNVKGFYQTLGLLWLSKQLFPSMNCSLIGIGEGLQKSTTPRPTAGRFTLGENVVYQNDSSDINGSFTLYHQGGRDANFKKLHSFLVAAKIFYRIIPELQLMGGTDYYSGTAYNADTAHESFTFNKLYGLNHSFNGSMEYWATPPSGGLVDYFGGIIYKPGVAWSINLTGHVFGISQEMKDKTGIMIEKNIGSEIDCSVNYQWSKEITIQGGCSKYFITTATKQVNALFDAQQHILETKAPTWMYLSLSIKPSFFKYSVQ